MWGTEKSEKCRNWLVPDGGYRIDIAIAAAAAGHLLCLHRRKTNECFCSSLNVRIILDSKPDENTMIWGAEGERRDDACMMYRTHHKLSVIGQYYIT